MQMPTLPAPRAFPALATLFLLLAACRSPAAPEVTLPLHGVDAPDGVAFSARSEAGGSGRTHVLLVLTNVNNRPVRVEYGACSFVLRVYATPSREGRPAWDSALRPTGCPDILLGATVPARGAAEVPAGSVGPEILGDSLPPGRYYLTLVLRPRGGVHLRLPAGEALLSR